MDDDIVGHVYGMGPRIPAVKAREALKKMGTSTLGYRIPTRVLAARAAATTTECTDKQLCEKPAGSSSMGLAIGLGVAIPVVVGLAVLLYLHRRVVKKQRHEDLNDPHKSLDFGLDENVGGKPKRKSFLTREKDLSQSSRFQRQQMSMDMDVPSPYLLPPALNTSQDSLHSLARTLRDDDPYRHVANYPGSDAGSIRSMPRGVDGGSTYTRSSSRQQGSRLSGSMNANGQYQPPPRQNSLPRPHVVSPEPVHMKSPQQMPLDDASLPYPTSRVSPPYPTSKDMGLAHTGPTGLATQREDDENMLTTSPIQEPPSVAQRITRKSMGSPFEASPADSGVEMGFAESDFPKHHSQDVFVAPGPTLTGLGLVDHIEPTQPSIHMSTVDSLPVSPVPQRGQVGSTAAPIIESPFEFYEYDDDTTTADHSPIGPGSMGQLDADEGRGRNMHRQSSLYEPSLPQGGLTLPQQDNRRLSVGFRPLPPDEIMESEDPEYRANRIRSFYKEYFEDGKGEGAPPVPPMPPAQRMAQYQQQGGAYYEDYQGNYQEDAPYFDPETNAFVMPYAQPVSRRAMTPPPTGQRFQGARQPRAFHGSMADMRIPQGPGPHGPFRPGSGASRSMGPRPGSSASNAYRPRAESSASFGGRNAGHKKPMAPLMDLSTLPNPSKLKDDSFAILNAADFAPPDTYADRVRGRSQSPSGERRPYRPTVPAHSPLVNAFEELPTLPSPHLLRTENTFTGLDFAPPRKFIEADSRSETGSIRSNRSGISAVNVAAIRKGAGRVSRLPEDTIFTQNAMQQKLKPSWTMRD
ncbi:hypothetical protein B0H63DRAFT_147960 [Podospora didyma]|uniref:Uncharacterized protein n=1 Tax=Podospora didyma TaxID=330526 RepID=A0AAE0NSU8_9PEZI|nr:hypothetical protein B0H63DRAFT_147960 [Podospora didyma]